MRARTVVKVCGLTRLEDAQAAVALGADWLGFIVAAGGPREIGPQGMAAIVRELPHALGVAVLMNVTPEQALALGREAGAKRLQLHRTDPATWPHDFPLPCAFVTGVDAEGRPAGPLAPPPHLLHLDTAHATLGGGTGVAFPWEHANAIAGERDFMLAGGLDGDNVAAALGRTRAFGVDAASRLERSAGIKDHDKMRRYIAAVREWDEHAGN